MKTVKATTASVIASLEPVYGILFAFFLLQEVPSIKELIGGVIILVVCYVASVKQD
jgi:drug/metabolite transporter (DMT)-like permease